ncbi:hypothetical protein [Iningainema tapete]|uniref:Uncharacterized protein n=2 Tax=Iningainema TaxID=1932705 RepID=A0A8J7C970_9CYAN|nr:hypothetical protein [Iningainema tapete BLCC-T55]
MSTFIDTTPQLDPNKILEEAITQTKYLAQEGLSFQTDDIFLCPLDFVSFLYPELAGCAQVALAEIIAQYGF